MYEPFANRTFFEEQFDSEESVESVTLKLTSLCPAVFTKQCFFDVCRPTLTQKLIKIIKNPDDPSHEMVQTEEEVLQAAQGIFDQKSYQKLRNYIWVSDWLRDICVVVCVNCV